MSYPRAIRHMVGSGRVRDVYRPGLNILTPDQSNHILCAACISMNGIRSFADVFEAVGYVLIRKGNGVSRVALYALARYGIFQVIEDKQVIPHAAEIGRIPAPVKEGIVSLVTPCNGNPIAPFTIHGVCGIISSMHRNHSPARIHRVDGVHIAAVNRRISATTIDSIDGAVTANQMVLA